LVTKKVSVALRTSAFVVLVCASLIAVDSWRSWTARTVQLHEMDVASSNVARAMATQAENTIKEADVSLVGIVERVETDGASPTALARLHKILVTRTKELPQLNGLFVLDKNGKWIADAQSTLLKSFNNADREYFVYHRTHPDRGVHIGFPVRSRSTGQWIVPVSRRIDLADGSFGGIALATINIDFFSKFYDSLDVGRAGAAVLVSDKGYMIVRRPFSDSVVGKSMLNTALFQAYTSQGPIGTAFTTSAQDNVTRLNSFRRVANYPMFVAAALSKDEILADWRNDTLLHSSGILLLVMLLAMFGWRLVKQIELRTETETNLLRARDALAELNRTLEKLAMQDGLTGLANRRRFDQTLSDELDKATREGSPLSLIMIDVDRFKQYNDIYGHAAGDECLRMICHTIQTLTARRPNDLAARYGGEEIAVLLPNTDGTVALSVAEAIRSAVLNLHIEHTGNAYGYVTLSAGIDARIPNLASDEAITLIEAADKALYRAKSNGRNRVFCEECVV
jgi:diguanylate cyclase (GGDEF)-like protein